MKLEEYLKVRKNLRTPNDFDRFGYPNYVLSSILTQKIVDYVMKRFKDYSTRLDVIERIWREKRRIPIKLPPVLRVRLLLKALGYSKSAVQNALKYPNELEDDLSRVVWRAITTDFVYSPIAVEFHTAKGFLGEKAVKDWLEGLGVEYETESELRKKLSKTPDFYLKEPLKLWDIEVRWIESKFMFGDLKTHSFYWRRQYYQYFREFGKGTVVYWSGHIEGLPFSISGQSIRNFKMVVEFKGFRKMNNEKFVKTLEDVLNKFKTGEKIEIKGNKKLVVFLKGLGFDILKRQNR